MFYFLIFLFLSLFFYLTYKNFFNALFLFLFLIPVYLIRFKILSIPTTLLEMMLIIIFINWIFKYKKDFLTKTKEFYKKNKLFFYSLIIFLISATLAIVVSSNTKSALGEWKAFYLEPILFFIILLTSIKTKKEINNLFFALVLSGTITSILAIYQHFTGFFVPYSFWENQNTYRVTAWYGFPNAVGHFLGVIFPLAIYLIISNFKENNLKKIISSLFVFLAILAIFFAKSTGAIIGILASIFLLLIYYKKTRLVTIIFSSVTLIIFTFIPLNNPIKQELLFQDRSGQIRLNIWNETSEFLKVNPIFGAGLASYSQKIIPFHKQVNGENIEIFHHPHNIFLTMWVNLGILGLISFVFLNLYCFYKYFKEKNILKFFALTTLSCFLVMGLVDSPYIKNDLSFIYWFVLFLFFVRYE
ncbi:MAG: O-antigen ligase family protein [Patescibacteria group bacterium]